MAVDLNMLARVQESCHFIRLTANRKTQGMFLFFNGSVQLSVAVMSQRGRQLGFVEVQEDSQRGKLASSCNMYFKVFLFTGGVESAALFDQKRRERYWHQAKTEI